MYDPALGEPGVPSYQMRMEASDKNAKQRDRMARRFNERLELESFYVGQAVGVFIDHAQRRQFKIQSSVIPGVIVQTDPGKDAAQTKYTVKYVRLCPFFCSFACSCGRSLLGMHVRTRYGQLSTPIHAWNLMKLPETMSKFAGLMDEALPSCISLEEAVKQFARDSKCRSVFFFFVGKVVADCSYETLLLARG